jgi:excisionase family DNA binding protein
MSQLVTSDKLSEIIGVPIWTIRKMVREKRIPAYSPSKKSYLFDPDEVIAAIKHNHLVK